MTPTLFVAGSIPRREMRRDYLDLLSSIYGDIRKWSEREHIPARIPEESPQWSQLDDREFSRQIRHLIQTSTHFFAVSVAESIATGIEAEYAHQLNIPIAVWYPKGAARSKILASMAVIESKDGEPVTATLARFLNP